MLYAEASLCLDFQSPELSSSQVSRSSTEVLARTNVGPTTDEEKLNSAAQSMAPPSFNEPPSPFEAGPPFTAPRQLSEKKRLRIAYEQADAHMQMLQSGTVPPSPVRMSQVVDAEAC